MSFKTVFSITHINNLDKMHPWDILEVDGVFYNVLPPNSKLIIGKNKCFWEMHMHTHTFQELDKSENLGTCKVRSSAGTNQHSPLIYTG